MDAAKDLAKQASLPTLLRPGRSGNGSDALLLVQKKTPSRAVTPVRTSVTSRCGAAAAPVVLRQQRRLSSGRLPSCPSSGGVSPVGQARASSTPPVQLETQSRPPSRVGSSSTGQILNRMEKWISSRPASDNSLGEIDAESAKDGVGLDEAVRDAFGSACGSGGRNQMYWQDFEKLCIKAGLLTSRFTVLDAHKLFFKTILPGKRFISPHQIGGLLKRIALERNLPERCVLQAVADTRPTAYSRPVVT
eukprot:TRINITY_DN38923_c0_g1_i1.p2 TRINITY_DN38923_c0_g1~~TRINITY_DN38923_c0_g1_i1.p2  ORF type:complete len:248 (+),score=40.76 TRINITY_DN38923_c0_g1_i1:77-820(+)